jgi:hypothetical protein
MQVVGVKYIRGADSQERFCVPEISKALVSKKVALFHAYLGALVTTAPKANSTTKQSSKKR